MTETETAVAGSTMKLTCSRDQLVEKLGTVGRALSARSSVQVLSGLLMRAEGGSLGLAATDMELSIRTSLEADIGEEGVVVVPGRLLVDLSRLLPEAAQRGDRNLRGGPGCVSGDRREGGALGLSRRVAPRVDRHPHALRRGQA